MVSVPKNPGNRLGSAPGLAHGRADAHTRFRPAQKVLRRGSDHPRRGTAHDLHRFAPRLGCHPAGYRQSPAVRTGAFPPDVESRRAIREEVITCASGRGVWLLVIGSSWWRAFRLVVGQTRRPAFRPARAAQRVAPLLAEAS